MGQWRRRLPQWHAPSNLLPLTGHPLNGTIRFPAPQEVNLFFRSEPQWSITCPMIWSINQEQSLQHVNVLRDTSYPNHAMPGWVPALLLGSVTSGKLFSLSRGFLTWDTLDFLNLLARIICFPSHKCYYYWLYIHDLVFKRKGKIHSCLGSMMMQLRFTDYWTPGDHVASAPCLRSSLSCINLFS